MYLMAESDGYGTGRWVHAHPGGFRTQMGMGSECSQRGKRKSAPKVTGTSQELAGFKQKWHRRPQRWVWVLSVPKDKKGTQG